MPEKNILFLDQYSGLSGGQKVLLDIITAFSKKGYRCLAGLPGEGLLSGKLEELKVETKFFPLGYYSITSKSIFDFLGFGLRLPVLIFLLARLIKHEKIGFVYANGARTFLWATAACKITNTPLVWHVHSIFRGKFLMFILNSFGKSGCVKKVFAVSQSAAMPLAELGKKLEVVYNAVRIDNLPKKKGILRKEFGLSDNIFLIASVGILEDWKNQLDLILAAKQIKDLGKAGIAFFIIGDSLYSNPRKQKYKNMLYGLVKKLGLEKKVIFTGFRRDIAEIMYSLDALAITSKDPDPCPLVGLEAASLGLALISTDAGGTKEIFQENKEALFYKAGDYKALAAKIILLSENHNLRNAQGMAARSKVEKNHNLDNYLQNLTAKIEKMLYEK
jgi:glycosyltransferase involved in cell wall biosynthesis